MASIDWGTLTLGALVGIGCRKQLKTAGRIAATTAASLAASAATAASQAAQQVAEASRSSEETAAQQLDGGQAAGNGNGKNG